MESTDPDIIIRKLTQERDEAQERFSTSQKRINQLERDFYDTQIYNTKLTEELDASRNELSSFREKIEAQNVLLQNEQSRRFDLECELDKTKEDSKTKIKECIDLQYTVALGKNQELQLKADLEDAHAMIQRLKSELDHVNLEFTTLNEQFLKEKAKGHDDCTKFDNLLQQHNQSQTLLTKAYEEKDSMEQKLYQEQEVLARLQQLLDDSNKALSESQSQISSLENQMRNKMESQQEYSKDLSTLEMEVNEREERIKQLEIVVKEMEDRSLQQDVATKALELESSRIKEEYKQQLISIQQYEVTCAHQMAEITQYQVMYQQCHEEKRLLEATINKIQNEKSQREADLSKLLQHFEQIENEHALLSKHLRGTEENLKSTNEQVKVLLGELEMSRQQLLSKEHEQVILQLNLDKVTHILGQNATELLQLRQQLHDQMLLLETKGTECQQWRSNFEKLQVETRTQLDEYQNMINERNTLGQQLNQSNHDRTLLQEKVKVTERLLRKGEKQHLERLNEIQLLKQSIKGLQREIYSLKKGSIVTKELARKDAELTEERKKLKILWDEMEKPLNIHRWRQLEGTDPSALEMLLKIQTLQKRLIKKTEEIMEKDSLLQEKERKCNEMERQLGRKIDLDSKHMQLSNQVQFSTQHKSRQMKAMAGELNMNQFQIHEYTKEINRLNGDLHELKGKYFEQKRREATADVRDLVWLHETSLSLFPQSRERSLQDGNIAVRL